MWKELKNRFQPDDKLSEMSMEEDLHVLKFTKKEEPDNLALKIAKISMRYKVKFTGLKKAAHILRLEKIHYADVLATKERVCQRTDQRLCKSKKLLDYMTDVWKLRRGIPDY
jgi:hypothetical protein